MDVGNPGSYFHSRGNNFPFVGIFRYPEYADHDGRQSRCPGRIADPGSNHPALVSVTPTPGLTDVPVVTVSRQIPRFYGTVTYGFNRSFALTEDQAWTFAEDYLAKAGVTSIQAYEVVPLGQSIRKDAADNQDVVWSFRVDRIESGVNKGGIITIDAYTGEVVEYAGFL